MVAFQNVEAVGRVADDLMERLGSERGELRRGSRTAREAW